MFLGLVQTFVIIRVLTVGEWGIIQLAVSIGGALGIYQHLGLASASTREISSAEKEEDIFKIFITSAVIRYAVTIPIAIGLFFLAPYVGGTVYRNSALIFPLKLYALTLLLQGVQSIFNSVISGTKRFRQLFIYQVVVSLVSVVIFIPFVLIYRINGYFYAFLLFNAVSSISLSYLAFKPLKGKLFFPKFKEFKVFFKEIFSISMAIYLVKIIYTNWEKFGTNALGLFNSPEVVAIFAFALLYAKKLMSISDAVTDVNLPVLSERYVKDMHDFKIIFTKNFDKIFILIIAVAVFATYWAPEIVYVVVGSNKYSAAYRLIPPVIFAFILYSFINIVKSSVLIPAKMAKHMIISFIVLLGATALFFIATFKALDPLYSMSWAMALGALLSMLFITFSVKKKVGFTFFTLDHYAILSQALVISLAVTPNILIKTVLFIFLYSLLIWGFFISGYANKREFVQLKSTALAFIKKRKKIK